MYEALYEIMPMCQFAYLTLSALIPEDTIIMSFPVSAGEAQIGTCNSIFRKKICRCAGVPSSTS
ncbi:hypothetical protein C4K04_4461 [Pseudomonas chlororaphis]|uniref:Uncharacterized protein n=1 Tax=Pseudomonas chlororaphis TaxID=587753 RepID=A0A3G7TSR5_9PSED|nr:hypothetical protein C4K04_4461 [Pseudomonas chlororaphis]